MKKTSLLFFILSFINVFFTYAQTVSLGTYSGAGSTNVLLSTSTTTNRYSRTISVYTAAEIIAAGGSSGTISSLAWDKYGTGEYTSGDAYIKIYLKEVSNSAWSTSPVPDWTTEVVGATQVFTSSTYSIPTGTGWKQVPFTTNFTWNGTSNIAVFVEWDRPSTPTADISWGRSTTTNANATRVGSTSLAALDMLVNSNRPLIQFTFVTGPTIAITSVDAFPLNNVAATITTSGGTLQMDSDVFPANANQNVTWSLVPGTGTATISATGLVTALTNGTVWAKAVSLQDATKSDSTQITISNQVIPVTSVDVFPLNNVAATITTNGGSLQMDSDVFPATANQNVTWSLVPGTGTATISATGLITALTNGTVWAKGVSVQDATKSDSTQITISNQIIPVTSVDVFPLNNVAAAITTNGGTLQMDADVFPANANQNVIWQLVPGTGMATISPTGLVTAISNGTVWARGRSVIDTTLSDSTLITISNQVIQITSVDVHTLNDVPAIISVAGGTLQIVADVLPANANQTVTWSIIPGTGTASISNTGLVTALTDGSVWAKAVSVQDAGKSDSVRIMISNQSTGINELIGSYGLQLYPNPVDQGVLTIRINAQYFRNNTMLTITDLSGRVLRNVTMTTPVYQIPVTDMATGQYLLQYHDDKNTLTTRFSVK